MSDRRDIQALVRASLTAAAVMVCAAPPRVHAEPPRASPTEAKASADPWAVLRDAGLPEAVRVEAARGLVLAAASQPVRERIERAIGEPLDNGASPGRTILVAVAREPGTPGKLFPVVAERLTRATPGERPVLLSALASFRTRESARLILGFATDAQPPEVARAAAASLERLCGQALGANRDAWSAWYRSVEPLSENEWRQRLVLGLAGLAERGSAGESAAVARLAETTRKLYLSTPADERPTFLAELLLDDAPGQRTLGFELVSRELASRGSLSGPVGKAALSLLANPSPGVRAQAAILMRQLSPPPEGAASGVLAALDGESDPSAAAELLLAAARWPARRAEGAVVKWLTPPDSGESDPGNRESRDQARRAASEAAWAFARAGEMSLLTTDRALTMIRKAGPDWTPSAVRLMAAAGDDDDRAAVARLLDGRQGELRATAAEALVWYPEFRGALLDAASRDPALFESACQAVWLGEPTGEDMRRLLGLQRPDEDRARRALATAATRLRATDALALASDAGEPWLRRMLLDDLTNPNRVMSESADPVQREAIAAGAVLVAEARLDAGQPDQALAVLGACPGPTGDRAMIDRSNDATTTALVALGRAADAALLPAGVRAWWRGWTMLATDAQNARETVGQIMMARFADRLTAEQVAQLRLGK